MAFLSGINHFNPGFGGFFWWEAWIIGNEWIAILKP